jgi:2-hydroxychromene-2-carboxylate isomerase
MTTARTLLYFMNPVSPWTYLGHARLLDMARRHRAEVRIRPVNLGTVFPQSGGLPLAKRAPQRQTYRLVELARWRDHLGVALNVQPKYFPVAGDDASRWIIAADKAFGADAALRLAGAMMRAVWAEERNIADLDTLAAIAAECGLDADALRAGAPAAQADYDAYTADAIARQVFGAPWYVYRDEPFWGQDRLDFLQRALERG